MLNLILAIVSSALISVIMRMSKPFVKNNIAMLAANYGICALFAWGDTGFATLFPSAAGVTTAVGLGIVNGALFLSGFVLLQWNVRKNGVVLSATYQRLGLLVSMLVSVVCFGEQPAPWQWFAFLLAVSAIVLMNWNGNGEKAANMAALLLMLLAGGTCDVMSKVYEQLGEQTLSAHFLLYTFLIAFALSLVMILWKREGLPNWKEMGFGLAVGIPNYYSAKFLLGAVTEVPAVIVYPVYSVATILVVTLTGVALFRERIEKRQGIALGMILLALVLLNIG